MLIETFGSILLLGFVIAFYLATQYFLSSPNSQAILRNTNRRFSISSPGNEWVAVTIFCILLYIVWAYTNRAILTTDIRYMVYAILGLTTFFSLILYGILKIERFRLLRGTIIEQLRFYVSFSSLIAVGSFIASVWSDFFFHASFMFAFPSAVCLAFILTDNLKLVVQDWDDILVLFRKLATSGNLKVLYPRISKTTGKFEFGFSNDFSDSILPGSIEIEKNTPLQEAGYFFSSDFSGITSDARLHSPGLKRYIQKFEGGDSLPRKVLQKVEDLALAHLLMMHLFPAQINQNSNFSQDQHSKEIDNRLLREIRWGKKSANALLAKNNIVQEIIPLDEIQKIKFPGISSFLIEHDWTAEQLSRAARVLANSLPGVMDSSQTDPSQKHLEEWFKLCKSLNLGEHETMELEYSKIVNYLLLLTRLNSGVPINRFRWEGMVSGFCDGCLVSHTAITQDKKIKIRKRSTSSQEQFEKAIRRINSANRDPVGEFIAMHDRMIHYFDRDSQFDSSEVEYIDSILQSMMGRLHHTHYLERRVKRGKLTTDDLIEIRKGIVAGVAISMSLLIEKMGVE